MKRVLIVLLAVVCLYSSCERKQTTSMENSEAGQLKTEMLSQQNTVGIEKNSPQISSRYHGIDFSTLPFNSAMLDMWNEETELAGNYQYRNSSLTKDELNRISNDYIEKNGFSEIEQKVVGYWFALDGISQADQGISFMDTLRRSRYPRLAIYPNGYFVISWANNGPMYIMEKAYKDELKTGLLEYLVRGKWRVTDNKLFLEFYQYLFYFYDIGRTYINLKTPFELELVDLDALTPDHFSTQPFAAFSQPPEILEQIPQDLVFITQPAYFIKSNYMWEIMDTLANTGRTSNIFSTADGMQSLKNLRGITLDDILTSTSGRLQEDDWD